MQIVAFVGCALIAAWQVFDADGARNRYFPAVLFAAFTAVVAWKFLRYRDRDRAVR